MVRYSGTEALARVMVEAEWNCGGSVLGSGRYLSSSAPSRQSARLNGSRTRSTLPASIFEKSRMSLMIVSSASPDDGSCRRSRAARC